MIQVESEHNMQCIVAYKARNLTAATEAGWCVWCGGMSLVLTGETYLYGPSTTNVMGGSAVLY